jgi:hypothetical protein
MAFQHGMLYYKESNWYLNWLKVIWEISLSLMPEQDVKSLAPRTEMLASFACHTTAGALLVSGPTRTTRPSHGLVSVGILSVALEMIMEEWFIM